MSAGLQWEKAEGWSTATVTPGSTSGDVICSIFGDVILNLSLPRACVALYASGAVLGRVAGYIQGGREGATLQVHTAARSSAKGTEDEAAQEQLPWKGGCELSRKGREQHPRSLDALWD